MQSGYTPNAQRLQPPNKKTLAAWRFGVAEVRENSRSRRSGWRCRLALRRTVGDGPADSGAAAHDRTAAPNDGRCTLGERDRSPPT